MHVLKAVVKLPSMHSNSCNKHDAINQVTFRHVCIYVMCINTSMLVVSCACYHQLPYNEAFIQKEARRESGYRCSCHTQALTSHCTVNAQACTIMAATTAGLKCCFSQFQAALGKYCVYLLADYITLAAAPPLDNRSVSSVGAGDTLLEALAGAPANALRQGALALYGACSPAEVSQRYVSNTLRR